MILHWPLPAVYQRITSTHGPAGNDGKPHTGIDISCEIGTPVLAAHDGVVHYEHTQAGGNVIRLIGSECYTRYCHLLSYTADEGESVKAGDEIARSGNTGSATTGPHLHFEVRTLTGTAYDPLTVMEVPMIGKLALHFQGMTSWASSVVGKYWPLNTNGWVKCINPPVPDPFPNTRVLGRAFWHPDNNNWEAQCIARGYAGGEEYFSYHLPYYEQRRGIVTAWEGPNEPNLTTVQAAHNYTDFLNGWRSRMKSHGFKVCGGSIAVGNPRLAYFGESNDILAIILPALSQCDYWSYHAYWDGRFIPADDWWALRYRRIYEAAQSLGVSLPPLIISECGCDHAGGRMDGWRARMDWATHWADLQAFDAELKRDKYVIAATLFTCAPNNDWVYFEYDQGQAETIGKARLGEAFPAPQKEGLPMDETATDAKTLVQKCRWWLEEMQRQAEAGNAAYAERIRLSLIQLLYRAENSF